MAQAMLPAQLKADNGSQDGRMASAALLAARLRAAAPLAEHARCRPAAAASQLALAPPQSPVPVLPARGAPHRRGIAAQCELATRRLPDADAPALVEGPPDAQQQAAAA